MWKFLPKQIQIEEKIVKEVQERVVVRTRIIERPDGTKETIIDEKKETNSSTISERKETPVGEDWSVIAAASSDVIKGGEAIYTIGVQRKLIFGLSGGLYARTDKEVGLLIGYSF